MKILKQMMFVIGGTCWLLFGVGFAIFLWQFLTQGAGLQLFGDFIPAVSSSSVLFGLTYFIGFSVASFVCFAVGIGLFSKIDRGK